MRGACQTEAEAFTGIEEKRDSALHHEVSLLPVGVQLLTFSGVVEDGNVTIFVRTADPQEIRFRPTSVACGIQTRVGLIGGISPVRLGEPVMKERVR